MVLGPCTVSQKMHACIFWLTVQGPNTIITVYCKSIAKAIVMHERSIAIIFKTLNLYNIMYRSNNFNTLAKYPELKW